MRLSANQNCWPAQQKVEQAVTAAIEREGFEVKRGHPYDRAAKHGFIASQKQGMEVFSKINPDARLIVAEDHVAPVFSIAIVYNVGSRNERQGRTGFAHLFEHMMFQGSKHHDSDYFAPFQAAGGKLNGSTNQDRTNYWETVPSNYLELALWMESDRMGFLLPAMTQEKLDNQRDVVKNERRQSYENRPYGLAYETILAAMCPPEHPYSWPTIGSMADIGAASREDVADFFRRYYHPANASLCIAGDFDATGWGVSVSRNVGEGTASIFWVNTPPTF